MLRSLLRVTLCLVPLFLTTPSYALGGKFFKKICMLINGDTTNAQIVDLPDAVSTTPPKVIDPIFRQKALDTLTALKELEPYGTKATAQQIQIFEEYMADTVAGNQDDLEIFSKVLGKFSYDIKEPLSKDLSIAIFKYTAPKVRNRFEEELSVLADKLGVTINSLVATGHSNDAVTLLLGELHNVDPELPTNIFASMFSGNTEGEYSAFAKFMKFYRTLGQDVTLKDRADLVVLYTRAQLRNAAFEDTYMQSGGGYSYLSEVGKYAKQAIFGIQLLQTEGLVETAKLKAIPEVIMSTFMGLEYDGSARRILSSISKLQIWSNYNGGSVITQGDPRGWQRRNFFHFDPYASLLNFFPSYFQPQPRR